MLDHRELRADWSMENLHGRTHSRWLSMNDLQTVVGNDKAHACMVISHRIETVVEVPARSPVALASMSRILMSGA